MALNNFSSAYSVTVHICHKLDMQFGDELFDIKLESDILATFYGPHTIIGSLPYALGLYICNWIDIGQFLWACLDRVKSGVYSFS